MNLKKFIQLFVLISIKVSFVFSQNDECLQVVTPTILIAGANYKVELPSFNDTVKYFIVGKGISLNEVDNQMYFTPNIQYCDSLIDIHLIEVSGKDTNFLDSRTYEVIAMLNPKVSLGKYQSGASINIHKDSMDQIGNINIESEINSIQSIKWLQIFTSVEIDGQEQRFYISGDKLSEEVLHTFSLLHTPTNVKVTVLITGTDRIQRAVELNYIIQSLSDKEYERIVDPYYKIHRNRNVQMISESTFYNRDTLVIMNSDGYYLHCLGDKNGGDITYKFISIDTRERFEKRIRFGKKDKIFNMRKKKGRYRLELYINDKFYDGIILIVE